jgi:hypothetical protein
MADPSTSQSYEIIREAGATSGDDFKRSQGADYLDAVSLLRCHAEAHRPLRFQAVWKRFSYPNSCKQPGAMDIDVIG